MTRDRVDERPFVAVRAHTYPCIALWRARKFIYVVEYERGIRVNKIRTEVFDREYELLHPHVNGSPDPSQEYNVQEAAKKYLNWGSYAGITEVASNALQTILNRKGNTDMSNIESAAATQGEAKVPAPEALGAALAKGANGKTAPKKASTKNGTTPAAKKAGKAIVTPAPKKNAKPAAKKNAKPAAKPTKKEAAKPAKKEAAKPAAKEKLTTKAAKPTKPKADGRGRPSSLDLEMRIKVIYTEGNPRREGTGQAYLNWPVIKRYDGKTVGAYKAAGGKLDNLRGDIARGHVKLVK